MRLKFTNDQLIDGKLPSELPAGLTRLDLSGCTSLTSLLELPATLTELVLINCRSLTALPELPDGLTNLNLFGCRSLTALPETLPNGLTRLIINNCTSLNFTQDLISRLSDIEARGVEVIYPSHFNVRDEAEKAKDKLEAAINSYHAKNPLKPKPSSIATLLHRFLSEGVGSRGGPKEIIASTEKVLEAITTNCDHLEWIEDIAAAGLAGCVNQPVAYWSEICAVMSMALAPTMKDKIIASQHLRALETVKQFIYNLSQEEKPGAEVEVEFGNALFREVHKNLLETKQLEKPWLGVPRQVAYEATIASKLTNKIISNATAFVIAKFQESFEATSNYLCTSVHGETWQMIVSQIFPDEIAAIKKEFGLQKEYYSHALELLGEFSEEDVFSAIEGKSSEDDKRKEVLEKINEKIASILGEDESEIEAFKERLILNKNEFHSAASKRVDSLKQELEAQLSHFIEVEESSEIIKFIKSKTLAALREVEVESAARSTPSSTASTATGKRVEVEASTSRSS